MRTRCDEGWDWVWRANPHLNSRALFCPPPDERLVFLESQLVLPMGVRETLSSETMAVGCWRGWGDGARGVALLGVSITPPTVSCLFLGALEASSSMKAQGPTAEGFNSRELKRYPPSGGSNCQSVAVLWREIRGLDFCRRRWV